MLGKSCLKTTVKENTLFRFTENSLDELFSKTELPQFFGFFLRELVFI